MVWDEVVWEEEDWKVEKREEEVEGGRGEDGRLMPRSANSSWRKN